MNVWTRRWDSLLYRLAWPIWSWWHNRSSRLRRHTEELRRWFPRIGGAELDPKRRTMTNTETDTGTKTMVKPRLYLDASAQSDELFRIVEDRT